MAKHLQVSSSGLLSDGAGGGRLLLRQKKNYSDVLTPTIETRSLSLQERSIPIKEHCFGHIFATTTKMLSTVKTLSTFGDKRESTSITWA